FHVIYSYRYTITRVNTKSKPNVYSLGLERRTIIPLFRLLYFRQSCKKSIKKYLFSFIPLAYNAIMKSIMLKEEYIMLQSIHKNIDHLYDEMVDIRRYLHQHPELSFEETETSKYISHFYVELGIPYK